jgi:excisionase family DNA binding protein
MAADFSTWIPKADIAASLGVAERTVDRKIKKLRLRVAQRDVPGRRPIIVLHPDDAETLKAQTVSAVPMESDQSDGTEVAVRPALPPAARDLVAAVMGTAPYPPRPLFLSLRDASEYSGLPQAYLRRLIQQGELPAVASNGYRVSKKALEWLADQTVPNTTVVDVHALPIAACSDCAELWPDAVAATLTKP